MAFSKNPAVYEIMWKNMVEPATPQMTIQGGAGNKQFPCRITATKKNTLITRNAHCVSTAAITTRTLLDVTLYLNCLSCLCYMELINKLWAKILNRWIVRQVVYFWSCRQKESTPINLAMWRLLIVSKQLRATVYLYAWITSQEWCVSIDQSYHAQAANEPWTVVYDPAVTSNTSYYIYSNQPAVWASRQNSCAVIVSSLLQISSQ